MLSVFPSFLTYSLLAPFILRLVLGLIFIDLGVLKFKSERARWLASFETLGIKPADLFLPVYAVIQIVGGIMLIIGLWTQVAALVFVISSAIELYIEWEASVMLKRTIVFYLLIFAISLSLLLTGAGAFAIDLPL
jgi:putative oxidoreductase